jgi:hypothetical protein
MGRTQLTAAVLIAMLTITSVHSLTLPSMNRKGAIDSATVEPTSPTTAGDVVLHVTVTDDLVLDRFDVRQIGKTFTVRVYWNEPGTPGAGPTHETTSLGTLEEGKYRVMVQSFCENRFAGTAQLTFEVTVAGTGGPAETIDEIRTNPANPTTSGTTTLHVEGHWASAGYVRNVAATQQVGTNISVDLYWESPAEAAAAVVTPYDFATPLQLAFAGTYTARVRVFLDNNLIDSGELTFEVTQGNNGDGWSWPYWD